MVDAVMALVALEALVLVALGRAAILPNLAAGFLLLIAMRLALSEAGIPVIGAALLLAGLAHAADLYRQLSLPRGRGPG